MKKILKKILRILLWCLIIGIFLLLLLALFSQTGMFRKLVVNAIMNQSDIFLDAELTIGSLEGNFYNHLKIRDLVIIDDGKRVLSLGELSLTYNLRTLVRKRISVNEILLNDLYILLAEEENGWNWTRIINLEPEEEISEPELRAVTEKKGPAWDLDIDKISISEVNLDITTLNNEENFIPSSIRNFHLNSSFSMKQNWIKLNMPECGFRIDWQEEHSMRINNLALVARMTDDEVELADLLLDTDNFILTVTGKSAIDLKNFLFNLDFFVQNATDFAFFIPAIDPQSSFRLTTKLIGADINLDMDLALQVDTGSLTANIFAINLPYLDADEEPKLEAEITFNDFNPSSWLLDDSFYLLLNGDVKFKGRGFDYTTGQFSLQTDLRNIVFNSSEFLANPLDISQIASDFRLSKGVLDGELSLLTNNYGLLEFNANIGEIEHLSDFHISGRSEKLDLQFLSVMGKRSSDLNFTFTARGKSPEERPIYVRFELTPSTIDNFPVESIYLQTELLEDGIRIDTLFCNIADNIIQSSGYLSQTEESQAEFLIEINNLSPILSWIEDNNAQENDDTEQTSPTTMAEMIETTGVLRGNLGGFPGELKLDGILTLKDSYYGDIYSAEIENRFTVSQDDDFFHVQMEMFLDNIWLNEMQVERIELTGDMNKERINIGLEIIQSPELTLFLDADIQQNEEIAITFKRMDLNLRGALWHLARESAHLIIKEDNFRFEDFILSSLEQSIELDGTISLKEDNDFRLVIEQLDLDLLSGFMADFPLLTGLLSIDASLQRTLSEPVIDARITLADYSLQDISDLTTTASISYQPSQNMVEAFINFQYQDTPYADIVLYVPITFSMEEGFILHKQLGFYVNIRTTDIALNAFEGLTEDVRGLEGILQAELTLGNTIDDIRAIGSVEIVNARFSVPEIGTTYRDVNLLLELDNNRFDLQTFNLRANQGSLNSKGYIIIGSDLLVEAESLLEDELTLFNLELNTDNFQLIRTSALDFLVNSRIMVEGNFSQPRVSGRININRGRVDVDRLMGDLISESAETPLLVQTRELQAVPEDESAVTAPEQRFEIRNLRGNIAVSFPRNIWIRSSDMNIEMSGDLNLIIDGTDPEIFGYLSTLRGYYVFYGRRFHIETGEIIFTGGRDFNPSLLVAALYSFRGLDSTRNQLRLKVSGSLEEMNITFELNDLPIEEADAISYILFGRSFDELTHGEKSEAQNQALVVGGFLANRLTDQISSVIGESFKLDVIEFRSDTTRSEIGLEVGKYITDNLFVSYKRDFSFDKTQEQVYEEILVEYEITRFLYLQASRRETNDFGVDLIWRFRWR